MIWTHNNNNNNNTTKSVENERIISGSVIIVIINDILSQRRCRLLGSESSTNPKLIVTIEQHGLLGLFHWTGLPQRPRRFNTCSDLFTSYLRKTSSLKQNIIVCICWIWFKLENVQRYQIITTHVIFHKMLVVFGYFVTFTLSCGLIGDLYGLFQDFIERNTFFYRKFEWMCCAYNDY